ncbi:hypothetical protein BN2476_990042 [Paraburkholderia piptadeniae]|uniref:Uncharacterized protein n=1 Tax=Paraburkholderia piptadeniae TaxID=1701573 RepID=A0A1N7SUP4_9BURK|nr:hypothetical protein BN2476_990042 [Paraburkholderia piptadeniae]
MGGFTRNAAKEQKRLGHHLSP